MNRIPGSLPWIAVALLLSTTFGCNKSDDTPSAPSTGGSSNTTPTGDHASFTLDGQAVVMQSSGGYGIGAYSTSGGDIGGLYQEAQGSVATNVMTMAPPSITWLVMKTFDTSTTYSEPDGTQIQSMFHVQSYPFGKSLENVGEASMTDGVMVGYYDANSVQWATDLGTGDQSGSSFHITSISAISNPYAHYSIAVTFNCKLYDGNGNVKTVTNGSIQGPAELY